jgi:hypothetical protein
VEEFTLKQSEDIFCDVKVVKKKIMAAVQTYIIFYILTVCIHYLVFHIINYNQP